MLEKLKELDQELLIALNNLNTPFFDFIMYWFSDRHIWFPFYGLLVAFLIWKLKWKSIYAIVAIILTIIFADQLTSSIMKPYFQRLRPCHEEFIQPLLHMVTGCGGKYGFVSSHAANSFGLAVIAYLMLRRRYPAFILLFLWAALVSYSRVYLGVHYPSDIILGAVIGSAIAWIVYYIYEWFLSKNYIRFPS